MRRQKCHRLWKEWKRAPQTIWKVEPALAVRSTWRTQLLKSPRHRGQHERVPLRKWQPCLTLCHRTLIYSPCPKKAAIWKGRQVKSLQVLDLCPKNHQPQPGEWGRRNGQHQHLQNSPLPAHPKVLRHLWRRLLASPKRSQTVQKMNLQPHQADRVTQNCPEAHEECLFPITSPSRQGRGQRHHKMLRLFLSLAMHCLAVPIEKMQFRKLQGRGCQRMRF